MPVKNFSGQDRDRVADLLGTRFRLTPADYRSILRELDSQTKGKTTERIVAETENEGKLIRARLEDSQIARLIVDIAGLDLLTIRTVREMLARNGTEDQLDLLNTFPGSKQSRGVSAESIARVVASRNWLPGKRWARHFVSVLGLPPALAGMPGDGGAPSVEDVKPHVPLPDLEDFQLDLKRQVVELLRASAGSNRAVLTLPTGAGKTRTTVEGLVDWWLQDHPGDFVLWIAQSDELCEQAAQAFREVWIDRGDQGVRGSLCIYRFWGTRHTLPDEGEEGIIVSTVDKLRSSLVGPGESQQGALNRIAPAIGAIVIDEAHRAEAPSYRKVLDALGVTFSSEARSEVPLLGLTATPLRSQHEETQRLARRFYNNLLRPGNLPSDPSDALAELRSRGVLSKPIHQLLHSGAKNLKMTEKQEAWLNEWQELHPEILHHLGEERDRNRQILKAILGLDSTWPVLFFGCSVQHARAMSILLNRQGRRSAAITAETKESTRRALIQSFKSGDLAVLCNFGVLTTGFDAPQVRAVVIGRPTASRVLYDQMIGRGMRGPKFGGTEDCLVIDVDDNLVHTNGKLFAGVSRTYTDYWSKA